MTSPRRDHWTGNFNVCGTPLAGDGPVFKFSSRPSLETGRLGRPPTCSFCACSVRHFLCLFRVKGPPPCRRWSRCRGADTDSEASGGPRLPVDPSRPGRLRPGAPVAGTNWQRPAGESRPGAGAPARHTTCGCCGRWQQRRLGYQVAAVDSESAVQCAVTVVAGPGAGVQSGPVPGARRRRGCTGSRPAGPRPG